MGVPGEMASNDFGSVGAHFEVVERSPDLDRRSRRDIDRHHRRVREAIKGNLPEIISQEDVITSDGQRIVKVPIRGLELPRFRFDPYRGEHGGQGDEGTRGQGGKASRRTRPGTVLGRTGEGTSGTGKEAGQQPGADYYEAEITVDELVDLAFEDLQLPDLQDKGKQTLKAPAVQFTTLRRTGPQANLDKRRTLIEAFKRSAREGAPGWQIDPSQDARYRSWEVTHEPQRNAVVFAMRDVSGSMGEFEAYLCRTFYTWMIRFLQRTYSGVEVVFITCHTEAKQVDEEEFFHAGSSGGTRMASAYELALSLVQKRYAPSDWNIYPFLFSDGYNWGDEECVDLVSRFLAVSNLVGYGEIANYGYWSGQSPDSSASWAPLGRAYADAFARERRFVMVRVGGKDDVWPALRQFMGRRHEEIAS
jgi:sporulation protein YhbH